jgi:hypothetical protein
MEGYVFKVEFECILSNEEIEDRLKENTMSHLCCKISESFSVVDRDLMKSLIEGTNLVPTT